MLYIGREEAVRTYAEGDPEIDTSHVFQGDIFHSVQLMAPRPGGVPDWPLTAAVVLSHHCEWTKAKKKMAQDEDWPILLAPAHELSDFGTSDKGTIRKGAFRYYLYLPAVGTIDRELVVDFRLSQPFSALDLARADYWTSVSAEVNRWIRAKQIEYLYRDFTAATCSSISSSWQTRPLLTNP